MTKVSLKDEHGKIYYGWYIVAISLFFMALGYSCVVSIVGVFVLPITSELHIQIGDFVAWTTIMSVTSIIYLFFASKHYNAKTVKPIMLVCALMGVIAFFGFSRSTELWHFYLFAVPMGICFGGLTATPCSTLVNNWFGAKCKGLALGLVFSGTSVLAMGLIPLINYITINLGWRMAYTIIAAALLIICVPLVLIFVVWSPEQKGISRMGDIEAETQGSAIEKDGIAFSVARKKISTWMMFFSGTLLVVASAAMLTHTQIFLQMSGYSPTFAANVMSAMIGALVIGGIIVGAYCDRFKLKTAAIATGILFAIAYIAQIYIPSFSGLIAVLIIGYGFGCTAVNIIPPLIANHMFGEKELTTYIGYINIFIGIGGAIGSTLVGKLLDYTGSYTVPFLVCGGLLLICALIRGVVTSEKYKFYPTVSK